MIGIIAALDKEIEGFLDKLTEKTGERICSIDYFKGKICGREVVLAKCGVGKVNAAMCAQTMIMKYAPDIIINSGVAGSLSPELSILDIAVAREVAQHDFDTTAAGGAHGYIQEINKTYLECDRITADGIMNAARELGIRAKLTRIATGDQFISDKTRKKWIAETFSASACDMESAAIAQVCHIAGTRFSAIRAISDSTDGKHDMEFYEFLPQAARNSVDVLIRYISRLQ